MLIQRQYSIVLQRLNKGEKLLEGHWEDPLYKKHVEKYNELMELRLEYEHANYLDWARDHICSL